MRTPNYVPAWDTSRKLRGEWWSPDSPNQRVQGHLRFKGGRPHLTIHSPTPGQPWASLSRASTVFGELTGGRKVTLWANTNTPMVYLGHASSETRVTHRRRYTYAVLGEHVGPFADERFAMSAVQFAGMKVWSSSPNALDWEDAHLSGLHLDEHETDYRVTVRVEDAGRESSRVVFTVEPPAPASFHDLLAFDLQALVTLLYQSSAPVTGEWLGLMPGTDGLPVVRRNGYQRRPPRKYVSGRMVATLRQTDPKPLFEGWWGTVDEWYPVPQVLSTFHHLHRGMLEGATAAAVAAAERLHEILGTSTVRVDPKLLKERRDKLLKEYPSDEAFRKFIVDKAKENRPTLDTKLDELLALVDESQLVALGIEDIAEWRTQVKKVRNPIAHSGSHVARRGNNQSASLHYVNWTTRAFATILVLQRIGLNTEALHGAARVLANNALHD